MRKLFLLLLLAGVITACQQQKKKFVDENYVANPTTLEELFSGFNSDEVTPDVYNFNRDSVVIIVTGHLYPLLYHPDVYNDFIETIKKQHPDYFFALGDLVYNNSDKEWKKVMTNFNKLNVPVYYAPGNHDLNYHYERYYGKHDHQIQAEERYLSWAKCRYKLVKDNVANYVFINANDSVKRILSYIDFIRPRLDTTKQMIMLTSQSLWFDKQQDPADPKTWPNRPFKREEILPKIKDFKHLIHGDWSGRFYRGKFRGFDVMAVGNRKEGDSLFVVRITVYKDSLVTRPVYVPLPENTSWYKKLKTENIE